MWTVQEIYPYLMPKSLADQKQHVPIMPIRHVLNIRPQTRIHLPINPFLQPSRKQRRPHRPRPHPPPLPAPTRPPPHRMIYKDYMRIYTFLLVVIVGVRAANTTPKPEDTHKEVDPNLIKPSDKVIEQVKIYDREPENQWRTM